VPQIGIGQVDEETAPWSESCGLVGLGNERGGDEAVKEGAQRHGGGFEGSEGAIGERIVVCEAEMEGEVACLTLGEAEEGSGEVGVTVRAAR
jgi:hypothetical protein